MAWGESLLSLFWGRKGVKTPYELAEVAGKEGGGQAESLTAPGGWDRRAAITWRGRWAAITGAAITEQGRLDAAHPPEGEGWVVQPWQKAQGGVWL